MNKFMFKALIVTFAATALSAGASAPAHATSPVVIPVNESFVIADMCPFPFQVTNVGVIRVQTHGNVTMNIYNFRTTFTNLNNAKSFSTPNSGPDIITTNTDGTGTLFAVGLQGRVTIPGQGVVFLRAGRLSLKLPEFTVVVDAGRHDDYAVPLPISSIAISRSPPAARAGAASLLLPRGGASSTIHYAVRGAVAGTGTGHSSLKRRGPSETRTASAMAAANGAMDFRNIALPNATPTFAMGVYSIFRVVVIRHDVCGCSFIYSRV